VIFITGTKDKMAPSARKREQATSRRDTARPSASVPPKKMSTKFSRISHHQTASPKQRSLGYSSDSDAEEFGSNKFADFVPTSLPTGKGVIVSKEIQVSFMETLDVMANVDFSSLSHDKSIEWNISLSKSCLRFYEEMTRLQHQVSSLQDTTNKKAETHKRDVFAKDAYPLIKKHCHKVFTRMVFPSKLEVTTTMGTTLCGFGLTSTCALANYIFDEIVFKHHGTSAHDIICVDDQSAHCRHEYDTPQIRNDLWVNYGIGSVSVKEVGRIRNTITNICRDATSKSCLSTVTPYSHRTNICSSHNLFLLLEEIFFRVDPTFSVLDETVREVPNKMYRRVEDLSNGSHRSSFHLSDLVSPCDKVEALLPVLAITCLRLNSSTGRVDKHIMQSVFACALFFNRAKLVPFSIHSRVSRSNLTPKAMAFLHGKRIMDMLTTSEETFVRFVILVDLMRYHSESLATAVQKYGALFTREETNDLLDFMKTYQGEKVENSGMPLSRNGKVLKGYRTSDIAIFVKIKNQVTEEREHVNLLMSEIDVTSKIGVNIGSFPSNRFDILPFTFHYPEFDPSIKKEDLVRHDSKKRKFEFSLDGTTDTASAAAMDFDDEKVQFGSYQEV